ncbi:hypothetical protein BX600DRAFT_439187 [Xylariales sp. PMI_506]|nr:hypothetical protein BX600DRAFT_439187 [Xylariales sp. PMI_506]
MATTATTTVVEPKVLKAVPPDTDLGLQYAQHGVVHIAQVEADKSLGHDDGVAVDDILARYPRFVHPHRRQDLEVGKLSLKYMLDRRILNRVEGWSGQWRAIHVLLQTAVGSRAVDASGQSFSAVAPRNVHCGMDRSRSGRRTEWRAESGAWIPLISLGLPCRQAIHLPEGMIPEQTAMDPGDALFFHGSMMHCSGPNFTSDRFRRSLIYHFIPQSSVEVAKFYLPLINPTGKEIVVAESTHGGICGDGWEPAGPH